MLRVSVFTGVVFHDAVPQKLSFDDAQTYCSSAGAELASTAQLYLAWSEGLDYCSPGWLSDGSVRYPITSPRDRCGGPRAGVRTLYRFRNQTGFPDPHSHHDVYCFKGEYIECLCFPNDSFIYEANKCRKTAFKGIYIQYIPCFFECFARSMRGTFSKHSF